MKEQSCAIGVDLGATKIVIALVDDKGNTLHSTRLPTAASGHPQTIIGKIAEEIRILLDATPLAPVGIGAGVAGQVDCSGEKVLFAPNLEWYDVPLQRELQQETGLPVVLVNDVRAATWAEWLFGAGRGCQDMVCLFVGTGIGGGVVSGGRILIGDSNSAGEVGHMPVALHGPPCHCGSHGCLEAIAGGWAIARRARELVIAEPLDGEMLKKMAESREEEISAALVARAARTGDPLAARIVAEAGEALVAGATGLINAFNPRRLVLGGGVIEGLPELVRQVDRGARARALPAACEKLEVLPAELPGKAGVIGAAALAIQRFGRAGGPKDRPALGGWPRSLQGEEPSGGF
jgi:glucokinase